MKRLGVFLIVMVAFAPTAMAVLDLGDYDVEYQAPTTIELANVINQLDNVSVTTAIYKKSGQHSYVYLYQVLNENLTHELHRITLAKFEGVTAADVGYLADAPGFLSGGIDPTGFDISASETLGFGVVYGQDDYSSVIYVTSEDRLVSDTLIFAQNGGQAYDTVPAPGGFVPEPATMVLLGLGAALIRKRK